MSKNTMPDFVKIAWFGKHFGEEPPLVGAGGAGTIFFTGCNLHCVYCQNYQISQQGLGKKYGVAELAGIMLELERDGAANIDLVSPTIWAEQIKQAIKLARQQGLKLPIVWNSNAYENVGMIKFLAGLVDIYLPDFKYADDELALKYSGVKDYAATAQTAIREMFKQVGNLQLGEDGLARKGLIVRHLILPGLAKNSLRALEQIKAIDGHIRVSLMSQYEPVFKAKDFPEINRNVTAAEYEQVFDYLMELGLDNGWIQAPDSHDGFLPDFNREKPFA
jgi:putative pyruvate formate lyase activating enzyme